MSDDTLSSGSLLMMARSRQTDENLSMREISLAQVRALHTRITNSGIKFSRDEKLDVMCLIFGRTFTTTKELTMGEACGILDFNDLDFHDILWWAKHSLQVSVPL